MVMIRDGGSVKGGRGKGGLIYCRELGEVQCKESQRQGPDLNGRRWGWGRWGHCLHLGLKYEKQKIVCSKKQTNKKSTRRMGNKVLCSSQISSYSSADSAGRPLTPPLLLGSSLSVPPSLAFSVFLSTPSCSVMPKQLVHSAVSGAQRELREAVI